MEKLSLDRDMYRRIKSMNRETMERTMQNVYESGWNDALGNNNASEVDETAVETGSAVDTEKLREELSKISGVGAKRLDEIMNVIGSVIGF